MSESVSHWLPALRAGDERTTNRVWHRYFRRVMLLARRHLGGLPRTASDEEDIALQTLHSFFRRVRSGSFAMLNNRDDLWRVLACIAKRKAVNHRRHYCSDKRLAKEMATAARHYRACASESWYEGFVTSADVAALEETREQLLAVLPDAELRAIAEAKLDGYTHLEIAARVHRSVPTIERRLRLIRQLWEQQQLSLR